MCFAYSTTVYGQFAGLIKEACLYADADWVSSSVSVRVARGQLGTKCIPDVTSSLQKENIPLHTDLILWQFSMSFHFPLPSKFAKYSKTIRLRISLPENILFRRLNGKFLLQYIYFYLQRCLLCSPEVYHISFFLFFYFDILPQWALLTSPNNFFFFKAKTGA